MTLSTYSDLSAAVVDFMQDANQSAHVDTYIALAEARFNRVIRHTDMESFTTLSATAETLALPSDAIGVKIMWIDGSPDDQLEELSLAALKQLYGGISGTPRAYAIAGGNIFFGPVPDSTGATVQCVYYARLSNLNVANATNWLMSLHPDIYLWGCLLAAEARGWNDSRLPLIEGKLDKSLQELTTAGQMKRYGGAPLQARAAVSA